MSRFFRGESSDSDSESSQSSGSDISDVEQDQVPRGGVSRAGEGAGAFSRNVLSDFSDSEDEDKKRVVKSAKDRVFDEAKECCIRMNSMMASDDWISVVPEYEKMNTLIERQMKKGINKQTLPGFFLKQLKVVDDHVKNKAPAKSDLTGNQTRGFNQLKIRSNKRMQQFKEEISQYSEKGEGDELELSVPVDKKPAVETESQDKPVEKSKQASVIEAVVTAKTSADSESDSGSEDDWGSESDSSESSSDDEDGGNVGINRWLKKDVKKKQDKSEKVEKSEKAGDRSTKEDKIAQTEARVQEQQKREEVRGFRMREKLGMVDGKVSGDQVSKQLQELQILRGKSSTDRVVLEELFEELLQACSNDLQRVKTLLEMTAAQIENRNNRSEVAGEAILTRIAKKLNELLSILEKNKNITVKETAAIPDDDEGDADYAGGVVEVTGSVVALIERTDEENYHSLQSVDPHTPEYLGHMQTQASLYKLLVRGYKYFEGKKETAAVGRLAMRRLERLYYLSGPAARVMDNSPPDVHEVMRKLCNVLYNSTDSQTRTRAVLMNIYYDALHNRYHQARDLLLMSHIQDSISHADVVTQVLYNRAVAQLGLAAFRCGFLRDSFNHLHELQTTGRVRDLLAQCSPSARYGTASADADRLERLRQLPYHMHINLELLECVYLVVSMLQEIPMLASCSPQGSRPRPISKLLRRLLDFGGRQVFTGPPESSRDHIVAAAKALSAANPDQCIKFLSGIPCWDLLVNKDSIFTHLEAEIRSVSIRIYLLSFATHYSSVSLQMLSHTSGLPIPKVKSILAKWIYAGDVVAAIDDSANTIVFDANTASNSDTNFLNSALALADKVVALSDANDRILDMKLNAAYGDKPPQFEGERRPRVPNRDPRWQQRFNNRRQQQNEQRTPFYT